MLSLGQRLNKADPSRPLAGNIQWEPKEYGRMGARRPGLSPNGTDWGANVIASCLVESAAGFVRWGRASAILIS